MAADTPARSGWGTNPSLARHHGMANAMQCDGGERRKHRRLPLLLTSTD